MGLPELVALMDGVGCPGVEDVLADAQDAAWQFAEEGVCEGGRSRGRLFEVLTFCLR